MGKWKSVIFDFDGTIGDSADHARDVASHLLSSVGRPACIQTRDDYIRHFGREALDRNFGLQHARSLREMHRVAMFHRSDTVVLFPHVINFIAKLKVPAIIVTAALAAGVRRALGKHTNLFSHILGHESGKKTEILPPLIEDSIYVGDTVGDIAVCRKVGIPIAAVGWGYDPIDSLCASAPDVFVMNSEDLFAWGRCQRLVDAHERTGEVIE